MEVRVIAKELLFIEPLADDGRSLFDSQRALALELVNVSNGGFEDKQPENVRIFLGQVLKPVNEPGARPLSKNLRRSLPKVIAKRISDPARAQEITAQIIAAIEQLKDPARFNKPLSDEKELEAFIAATTNPDMRRVVIITSEPAEIQPDETERANELTDALISRVINTNSGTFDSQCSYDFFIPDDSTAENMRLALIKRVSQLCTKNDFAAASKFVENAQVEERLNIYYIKGNNFFSPTCIFEPLSREVQGYNLYYHDGNNVSIAVLNKFAIRQWFETFFRPIFVLRSKYELSPIGQTKPIDERLNLADLKAA